ncbi:MAG: T9SS type A sorting domain-containing protein [Bacteroidota bacterium]
MKTIFYHLLFCLFFVPKLAFACDCIYIDNFCETLTFGNNGVINETWSIHHVTIAATHSEGVNVKVIKTYHGIDLEDRTAFIRRGDGGNCQLNTDVFSVNEEYLVVAGISGGGEWGVSACGITVLKIEGSTAKGPIAPDLTQVALADLTSLTECGEMSVVPNNEPYIEPAVSVLPSLATDFVTVRTSSSDQFYVALAVYDASGRLIYKERDFGFNQNTELVVDVNNWSNGLYFFRVNIAGKSNTVRIVKQEP